MIAPLNTIASEKITAVVIPPKISGFAFSGRDLFSEIAAEAQTKYGVSKIIDLSDLWYRDLARDMLNPQ